MTIVRILAVAAVATSLACSEGVDRGHLVGPEFAKGKPNLNTAQVCEAQPSGDFFSGLAALCVTTANTEFTPTNADRDRRGLIARLNRAGQKCSEDGNVDGTVDKLTGFRDKVVSLRAQGKISEPAGVDLAGDAQALIDSFDPDLTTSPLTCPSGDPAAG